MSSPNHPYKFFDSVQHSFDKASEFTNGIKVSWNKLKSATVFIV